MGAGTAAAPTGSLNFGNAQVQFKGSPKPMLVSSGNGSSNTVGLAGASFTSFLYNPPQDPRKVPILEVSVGTLYVYLNGTWTQISSPATGYVYTATFTPAGNILYVGYDIASRSVQIFQCAPDGTLAKKITASSNVGSDSRAVMSPDGTTILFDNKTAGSLYRITSSGTGETLLSTTATTPSFAPNGLSYIYVDPNSMNLVRVPLAGGSGVPIELYSAVGGGWNPNSQYIAAIFGSGISYKIEVTDSLGNLSNFGTATASAIVPAFSPDGKYLLYDDATGAPSIASWTGAGTSEIQGVTNITSLDWSPFYKPKYFIGTTGAVAASAAGFLATSNQGAFSSLFAFTATTPASSSVSQVGSQIFEVTADAITGYRYMNGYNSQLNIATPPVGTKQLLVSVDSGTGQVAAVAAYKSAVAHRSSVKSGDLETLSGPFTTVYNSKGINLAPAGAASLTLNAKTGAIVAVR